ncbi:MAG: hypothetical protein JWQ76_1445 [Ramlibacter sp.]|nr:hypothetical protein [Ramlibacter sp.]
MLRSTLTTLSALAALLLASGCNLERIEMDDGVVPVATTAAAAMPMQGQQIHRMFEAEKRNATMTELPTLF